MTEHQPTKSVICTYYYRDQYNSYETIKNYKAGYEQGNRLS